jgi:GxxExxY protein
MTEDELSNIVLGCAIEIHKELGPGLLESAYKECLCYELSKRNLNFVKEKPLPLVYKELSVNCVYRMDIVVENKLVIEIKSVEHLMDIHTAQVITYLKLSGYKLGLLINFNHKLLKNGIKRVIL